MTFAFYQSLVTQPRELDEAARMLRLTQVAAVLAAGRAQRDDPAGLERDDELRRRLVLPGRLRGDQRAATTPTRCPASAATWPRPARTASWVGCCSRSAVMVVMVVAVNVLFWRPLTAWAERFRVEESEAAQAPRSLVLDLLRRSSVPDVRGPRAPPRRAGCWTRLTRPFGLAEYPLTVSSARRRVGDVVFTVAVGARAGLGRGRGVRLRRTAPSASARSPTPSPSAWPPSPGSSCWSWSPPWCGCRSGCGSG